MRWYLRLVAILTMLGACSLGLPSESEALSDFALAKSTAERVVVDAIGPGAVLEWQDKPGVEGSCPCADCGQLFSSASVAGEYSHDALAGSLTAAAEALGGSASEPELFGRTWFVRVEVPGTDRTSRLEFLWDDGMNRAEALVSSGCYSMDR